MTITQELLKHYFDYRNGGLFIKNKLSSKQIIGSQAGSYSKTINRRQIGILGNNYRESIIIWMWHYGEIPANLIVDHVDRNPLNNKIDNLRLATRQQNCYNQFRITQNKTGFKGVSFDKWMNKFVARIRTNTGYKNLGRYNTKEQAALAYNNAAKEIHGDFALLNVI